MTPATLLACTIVAAASASAASADPPPAAAEETWAGSLDVGHGTLRLVIHLRASDDGWHASIDSPDQGAFGLPVDEVHLEGRALRLTMRSLGAAFEGELDASCTTLDGTWTQRDARLPVTLRSGTALPVPSRPQEPRPPFPYDTREVRVENAAAAVTLAGTLAVPRGAGPWPTVLLISGTGAQDRDETVFGHRPFLVLADHLARRGVAVLRLDDRGVGGSTGRPDAPVDELASDALAAVAFLRTVPGVDARSIGLVGHSEGGVIAVRAAARSSAVAFAVLLGAPALPGEELLHLQNERLLRASGSDDAAVAAARALNARVYRIVRAGRDAEATAVALRAVLGEAGLPKDAADAQVSVLLSPWFRSFLSHDPRPDLARLRVPVLAAWGERDLQVPAAENLAALRRALAPTAVRGVTMRVFPRVNHLLQTCETGLPTEYGALEETVAPDVLEAIARWIAARGGARR